MADNYQHYSSRDQRGGGRGNRGHDRGRGNRGYDRGRGRGNNHQVGSYEQASHGRQEGYQGDSNRRGNQSARQFSNSPSTSAQSQQFVHIQSSSAANVRPHGFRLPSRSLPPADDSLPKRPDQGGIQGQKIRIMSNSVNLKLPSIPFFMYDVHVFDIRGERKREIKKKIDKKSIVWNAIQKYKELKDVGLFYDGQAIAYALGKIPHVQKNTPTNYSVEFNQQKCQIEIKETKEGGGNLQDLMDFTKPENVNGISIPQIELQFLNTFFHCILTEDGVLMKTGRTSLFFSQPIAFPIRHFVYHEGFHISARPQRGCVRLMIDKTQVVFYKEQSLIALVGDLLGHNRYPQLSSNDFIILKKQLKNLRVQTNHLPYVRNYKINDVKKESIGKIKISVNGQLKSVYDYMVQTYPQLRNQIKTNSLCIQHSKETFIPMELCSVIPNQSAPPKERAIVSEVIKRAAIPPFQRRQLLEDFLQNTISTINSKQHEYLKENAININSEFLQIQARILNRPCLTFANQQREHVSGKWSFQNKKFPIPANDCNGNNQQQQQNKKPFNWALIYFNTKNSRERICEKDKNFDTNINTFTTAGFKTGVLVEARPSEICLIDEIHVEKTIGDLQKKSNDFVLIVGPQNYGLVKVCGDLHLGIVTQVVRAETWIKRFNMQTATNIWLKLNGKLGGVDWLLFDDPPNVEQSLKEVVIIFGADVTHPSPGDTLAKSVVGVVATTDLSCMRYAAVVKTQDPKLEIINDLKAIVSDLLKNFKRTTGFKPTGILFYRDGVSEGQFRQVRDSEILRIQDACNKLQSDYNPGITFIVTQKRHIGRFFASEERGGQQRAFNANLQPGTVIDTDVITPRQFDFYLNSHEAIKGTSKCAHYHVLWDDNNWGSDDLQNFTYLLCHGYMRCCRSVSYAAPTYYSHLAAYRGRVWVSCQEKEGNEEEIIETKLHDNFKSSMFFL